MHSAGYMYFDHRYVLVAVNAFAFGCDSCVSFGSLYFTRYTSCRAHRPRVMRLMFCPLDPASRDARFSRAGRSDPLTGAAPLRRRHCFNVPTLSETALRTAKRLRPIPPEMFPRVTDAGFKEYAWVTASEVLGDYIFTRSGGFLFSKGLGRSFYMPLVPHPVCAAGETLAPEWQPCMLDDSVHIPELSAGTKRRSGIGAGAGGKFSCNDMTFAHSEVSLLLALSPPAPGPPLPCSAPSGVATPCAVVRARHDRLSDPRARNCATARTRQSCVYDSVRQRCGGCSRGRARLRDTPRHVSGATRTYCKPLLGRVTTEKFETFPVSPGHPAPVLMSRAS